MSLYGRFEEITHSPVPAPELLAAYREIDPEIVPWILRRTEMEADHRHGLERQQQQADIEDSIEDRKIEKRGQWFAFGIGTIALVCATIVAGLGAQWTASIIGGGGIGSLVTAFIWGKQQETKLAKLVIENQGQLSEDEDEDE